MKKSEKASLISEILDQHYPRTPIPLDHTDHFTLLVAVLLSAQCTDERVNTVTPVLFKKAFLNKTEVTVFPLSSVHCAERRTATRRVK